VETVAASLIAAVPATIAATASWRHAKHASRAVNGVPKGARTLRDMVGDVSERTEDTRQQVRELRLDVAALDREIKSTRVRVEHLEGAPQ